MLCEEIDGAMAATGYISVLVAQPGDRLDRLSNVLDESITIQAQAMTLVENVIDDGAFNDSLPVLRMMHRMAARISGVLFDKAKSHPELRNRLTDAAEAWEDVADTIYWNLPEVNAEIEAAKKRGDSVAWDDVKRELGLDDDL